jgi:predicted glycoside hydrolase/deacetylase ChbG (UPF0249 family)
VRNERTTQGGIRLVTRADDIGTCRSVNRAARDACVDGILRNVSLMAPAADVDHAAELLVDLPGLCIGMHTTFATEFTGDRRLRPVLPVEQVPSIVDEDGYLYNTAWQLAAQDPASDELAAELEAQLALLRAKGMDVEYIDVHMHIGPLPELQEAITEMGRREGLMLAHRWPAPILPKLNGPFETPVQALLARLAAVESGDYVFIGHPCYDTAEMRELWTGKRPEVALERDWQRRTLMDAVVLDYFRLHGIEPIRYTDLPVD